MSLTEPSGTITGATEDSKNYSDQQLKSLSNKSKQADFEKKIVEWTKSAYQRCRTVRQQIERQWYINLAFYIGKQNVAVIPISSASSAATGVRLYIPPAPYYRSRPVINRIRPIIRTELAKLTAQKPTATIVPATSDDKDLAAAQAGEQIWDTVYREKKIKSIFGQTMLWTLTCGTGFMKTYWDPQKPDREGNPGDFCYENITPFNLFVPDMLCQDIEDQPYIIHIQAKSPEWVKANYPNLPVQPNVMAANDILNDSFLNLVGASDFRKNAVLCYEVWIKPGQLDFMPNGGMFTLIGDTVVQWVDGNPYIHQQYPFVKFEHIPTGRFYADSIINDLIPIQREYNRTRGQMIEAKNRMSHPQIMAAEGSIDASKITTEPGQVILYKLGFPAPTPLPLQNLPNYVVQEVERLLMDFEDISGQHQVSKGNVPPGVTAATAISFLQEQDESMLSTTFSNIEEGMEKIGYQTLCYVKQYWDTPRVVKVVGRGGQFNVLAFQGSDLRSNTDIRIEAGSALPTSKSAKQALLMDLMSQGFIPPEKGLELMDVGGVQRLYEEVQIDSAQAMRENMKMSTITDQDMNAYLQTFMGMDPATGRPQLVDPNSGQPLTDQMGNPTAPPLIVPVNSYDNHQIHIQVHNNFRKGQEYENLPQRLKDLFEEHVNQHMMALGMIPGIPTPMQGANQVTSGAAGSDQTTQDASQSTEGQQQLPPEVAAQQQQQMGGFPNG
ncbi:portal protein [Streptomyces anandii]|uniref:portal protein n=1 Tax=Streptomyces anandii TaxID=285454 RepID=UPI0036C85041